ncbi:MAG: 2-dehydropantoate 2-reductase [Methyloligellaceae bacterium]
MSKNIKNSPHVVVLGAGAIGCFVGGAWQDAGVKVTYIGRERIAGEVREYGLVLSDNRGYSASLPAEDISYSTDPAVLKEADIIALAVKNTGTEEAVKEIAAYTGDDVPVISLQNGVSNAERLSGYLPGREILAGMVPYNIAALGEGRWHKGSPGNVIIKKSAASQEIAEIIADHPIKMLLEEDMEPIVWGKLLLNLNNAVNALSGRSLLEELKQRGYRKVIAGTIMETLAVLDAKGIIPAKVGNLSPSDMAKFFDVPDEIYHPLVEGKIDPKATSSMADDFAAGRPTEIDYLNGEVVKAAELLGIATPVNKKIIQLVKEAEQGGRRNWSPEDLVQEVLG